MFELTHDPYNRNQVSFGLATSWNILKELEACLILGSGLEILVHKRYCEPLLKDKLVSYFEFFKDPSPI